ncbi:COPIA protein, partial [Pseudoatta argentina]
MYLSVCTRPDIAHAASYLSQFNNCHGSDHWTAAKRVLRYLKGTRDVGLVYGKTSDPLTGYQRTVALSSMEAEYMAISDATKEAVHLRSFILELSPGSNGKITLYSDNIGAIKLAENPVFHNRSKHIDVRHHFVRGIVDNGEIELSYKSTEDMAADILTKGLPGLKHRKCVKSLGLSCDYMRTD